MKRSLTIGCVLLVGGGVSNCGGSAEIGTPGGEEQGHHAGASGSGVNGGFTGTIGDAPYVGVPVYTGGAGGAYVGSMIGSAPGTGPAVGVAGGPGMLRAGAGGWDAMGVGPELAAGDGGESGSAGAPPVVGDVPPVVGTAPQGGSGGWGVGIPN